jgi:hypothetical protein
MTPTDRPPTATSKGWRTALRWLLTSIAGGLGGLICTMFLGAILLTPRHNPAGFPLLTSGDFLIWLGGCALGSYLLSRATRPAHVTLRMWSLVCAIGGPLCLMSLGFTIIAGLIRLNSWQHGQQSARIADVRVEHDSAFIVLPDRSLEIFDISDPAHLQLRAEPRELGSVFGVDVVGDHAYLAGTQGLEIVDVRDPAHPRRLGRTLDKTGWSVDVVDNIAYVVTNDGLQIVDVRDPAHPLLRGSYGSPLPAQNFRIAIVNQLAYVVDWETLQIVDVRDPAHPQRIGMLRMPKATQIQVVGQLAYVTAEGVVQIVDISNPSHPIARGSIANANEVRDAQIVGQRAYVITFDQELQIVDVRDPTHTTPRGAMPLSGIPQSVRVSDGIAYVATYSGGVQIVDIADPAHASLIGTCVIQNSGPGCAWW